MANPSLYYRPATLAETIRYMQIPNSIALAGGALAFAGMEMPYNCLVDLQDLDDLKKIEHDDRALFIGSVVTLQQVIESPDVPDVLKKTITRTLPLNLRNNTSIGESLIVPEPPLEWLAALIALDAEVEWMLSEDSLEFIPISYLLDTFSQTARTQGIITQLVIPVLQPSEALGIASVSRTPADQPIVNAAVYVRLDDTRKIQAATTAIGGACADPIIHFSLAVTGYPLDETTIQGTMELVTSQVDPVDDYRGSADYRREMAAVCVRRALQQCSEILARS